jgi:hypothetical protein
MKKLLILSFLLASPLPAQPSISSIYPPSGPTSGGTFVHILGSGLFGLPLACPALACSNYVQFGDALGTIVINTDTEIVVQTPPHAAVTVDVAVNIAGKGKITFPLAFRYDNPDPSSYERVLLPVLASNAPGAFGSLWQSEASLSNHSDTGVTINYGACEGQGLFCFSLLVPTHGTVFLTPFNEAGGLFLSVPRGRIDDIDINLRVQDVSRQSQTWGTEIPVVRDTDFRGLVWLHNVPTDARFRSALRAYNYDVTGAIRVRIFDEATGALLVDDVASTGSPFYVQIASLADTYRQIAGHDRVRVAVESASSPQKPIWAFVSVTNNETQHVTVIAPWP